MKIIDLFQHDDSDKVYVIAELSANHAHKFNVAVDTIKAVKKCGADAIKLQTYTADTITIDCNNEYFQIHGGTLWDGKTLFNLYKEAYTPWEWQPELKRIAEEEGLECFSSPFDHTAVDFLETLNVPAYKVASFEITDLPLIKYIASKQKPVIISTGVATLSDIEDAVATCRQIGNTNIALLQCTSEYPAPMKETNLRIIADLKKRFNVISGISDHTIGATAAIAAATLGAKIVEKHFILDRNIGGPDASFSMEPHEFQLMIESIRDIEIALGKADYGLSEKNKKNRIFCRSLFVINDIKKGETFSKDNIRSIRPGYGISPKYFDNILGKKATQDIKRGIPLQWEFIE